MADFGRHHKETAGIAPSASTFVSTEWGINVRATMFVVEDDTPQPTGLLDAQGNQLYRASPRRPIGFTAKWID